MYGTATDPMPYIYGAYLCGVLFCVGGFAWVHTHGSKLKQKLEAIKTPEQT